MEDPTTFTDTPTSLRLKHQTARVAVSLASLSRCRSLESLFERLQCLLQTAPNKNRRDYMIPYIGCENYNTLKHDFFKKHGGCR